MDFRDEIPGYREALDQEGQSRRAAFSPLPELICGIAVLPLSLSHLLLLQMVQSPFLTAGKPPTPEQIGQFLFIVSPQYDRLNGCDPMSLRFRLARWAFLRSVRKLDYLTSYKAITAYVDEAFQDSPGGDRASFHVEYYCGLASIVSSVAAELHWSEREILRMPLKRLFQYQRCITRRHDSDAIFFNPSDRVRGQWLASRGGLNHE